MRVGGRFCGVVGTPFCASPYPKAIGFSSFPPTMTKASEAVKTNPEGRVAVREISTGLLLRVGCWCKKRWANSRALTSLRRSAWRLPMGSNNKRVMTVKIFFITAKLRIFFQSACSNAQKPVLTWLNGGEFLTFYYFIEVDI